MFTIGLLKFRTFKCESAQKQPKIAQKKNNELQFPKRSKKKRIGLF